MQIKVLGPDDRSTLTTQSNLAVAYQAADRPADARALFEQIRPIQERVVRMEIALDDGSKEWADLYARVRSGPVRDQIT